MRERCGSYAPLCERKGTARVDAFRPLFHLTLSRDFSGCLAEPEIFRSRTEHFPQIIPNDKPPKRTKKGQKGPRAMRAQCALNARRCDGMRTSKSDFFGLFTPFRRGPDFGPSVRGVVINLLAYGEISP